MRPAPDDPGLDSRHAQVRRVLAWVLVFNIAVVIAKLLAGVLTHTLSVVAEAAHSSVDALNHILALALARVAARAPDEQHPYGHARFETLGALGIVAFLSITVFELVSRAVGRLIGDGVAPRATAAVVLVMAASAGISFFVSRYEARRGRELRSELLIADAAHTRSDMYASLAVLAGLGLISAGYEWADGAVTLLVAALIARAGWSILKTTIPILVDERAVEPRTIRHLALDTAGVDDCYDVRSRGREGEIFAELTIAVSGKLSVEAAHKIADDV